MLSATTICEPTAGQVKCADLYPPLSCTDSFVIIFRIFPMNVDAERSGRKHHFYCPVRYPATLFDIG